MLYTKIFINVFHLIIQKIDNVIYIYIERKFANL